jgi:hypothetical protein
MLTASRHLIEKYDQNPSPRPIGQHRAGERGKMGDGRSCRLARPGARPGLGGYRRILKKYRVIPAAINQFLAERGNIR